MTRSIAIMQDQPGRFATLAAGLALAALTSLACGANAFACPAKERVGGDVALVEQLVARHGWRPGICRLVEPPDQAEPAREHPSLAAAIALGQLLAPAAGSAAPDAAGDRAP